MNTFFLTTKAVLSGGIVAAVSELAKRNTTAALSIRSRSSRCLRSCGSIPTRTTPH